MSRRRPAIDRKTIHNLSVIRSTGSPPQSRILLDNAYSPFVIPQEDYASSIQGTPQSQAFSQRDDYFDGHSRQIQNDWNYKENQVEEYEQKEESDEASSSQPLTDTPSRKRKAHVDLRKQLEHSTKNGKFDLYKAGRALHNAYENNQVGISQDVSAFLSKACMDIPIPKLPESITTGLSPEASSLLHGYGLAAQMALVAAKKALSELRESRPSPEELDCVSDAPYAVKARYSFPTSQPFSGKAIDVKSITLVDSATPAHVRLQKYLFEVLGKSCSPQTEIQRFWILPGERKFAYGTPSPFPKDLYDQLKQIFLEFFQFDHEEFDQPIYKEEYGNISILRNYGTSESKQRKFTQMAAAKRNFLTSSFRTQFKNALKELRAGTFIISEGSSEGFFARRKRNNRKDDSTTKKNNVPMNGEDGDVQEGDENNEINIVD